MSLLAGTTGIAIPIANLISGYIYASGGYLAIWITALGLYACAILNVLAGVRETRASKMNKEIFINETERTTKKVEIFQDWVFIKNICKDITKYLLSSFRETLRKRQGYKRACIWLLVITTCILSFVKGTQSWYTYVYSEVKLIKWIQPTTT